MIDIEKKINDLFVAHGAREQTDDLLQAVLSTLSGVDELSKEITIDTSRQDRCGFPEVIYGASKTSDQLVQICDLFITKEMNILITRLSQEKASVICQKFPDIQYDEIAQTAMQIFNSSDLSGTVKVVTAGTSDSSVANEALNTLLFLGYDAELIGDVGVAGLHRLLRKKELLDTADVLIVVAGMEGALPSVIGGLVDKPVIAVPTSVGYGASSHGIAALLGMLSSCASGLTVCNIDNGFGAACAAHRILKLIQNS